MKAFLWQVHLQLQFVSEIARDLVVEINWRTKGIVRIVDKNEQNRPKAIKKRPPKT